MVYASQLNNSFVRRCLVDISRAPRRGRLYNDVRRLRKASRKLLKDNFSLSNIALFD